MGSTADKAAKARAKAEEENYGRGSSSYKTDKIVMDATRGKEKGVAKALTSFGVGRYPNAAEQRAANIVQQRRRLDTAKTAARATAIEKRTAVKSKANTTIAGVNGGAPKKQAPKATAKPVTKAVAKTTTKKTGKK